MLSISGILLFLVLEKDRMAKIIDRGIPTLG